MKTQYCFSSPNGDIEINTDQLQGPFLVAQGKPHDSLSLGDYFKALLHFALRDNGLHLRKAINSYRTVHLKDEEEFDAIILRSEKHGKFYHIASLEVYLGKDQYKFAITTAVSDFGKTTLHRDYLLMQELSGEMTPSLVSVPFFDGVVTADDTDKSVMRMMLSEWLEDYHEWHASYENERATCRLVVWDYYKGNYFLDEGQEYQLVKGISKILTLYFNSLTGQQIYPWHHSAGDFIMKNDDGVLSVKLITVRGYQSLISVDSEDGAARLANLINFFVHLSIRMRLDRVDGVGEGCWLGEHAVRPVIDGFFEALTEKDFSGVGFDSGVFINIVQAFSVADFTAVCEHLLDIYNEESEMDYLLIEKNLESHLEKIVEELVNVQKPHP